MDSSAAQVSPENRGTYYNEIWRMVQDSALHLSGSEQERLELIELKSDLDNWLLALQNTRGWMFPAKLRMLNASEFRVRQWLARSRGEQLPVEDTVITAREDRRLAAEQETFGHPAPEIITRVVILVEKLRAIWVATSIKFAEAVAKDSTSMEERILRCQGVVDFK